MTSPGASLGLLGANIGGAGLVGAAMGYAAKKVAKIVGIIIGLELGFLAFLQQQGIIAVKWGQISAVFSGAAESGASNAAHYTQMVLGMSTLAAGFVGGFALGFKKA